MKTYRTLITVQDAGSIVLNNVPVQPGDQVEIIVRPQGEGQETGAERMKELLQETQSLPHLASLSEEEIAQEIATLRSES